MTRFDRYMLSQLMVLFGFFALILVTVYWINQAVKLFDLLIGDGHTAWIFAEFTALILPNVIRLVLPTAAFAAAVYVTNRLSSESELTVMQATGFSPWRLARPVLYFGLIAALMLSVLTHFLVPLSLTQLREREAEISRNVTNKILTEGTFLHPADKVTFFIREITPDGTLSDVFLSDRRNPDYSVTYTADSAYLLRDDDRASLVMVDGLSQTLNRDTETLFTTHFSDFSYDISAMVANEPVSVFAISNAPTAMLITDPEGVAARVNGTVGEVAEELHARFLQPMMALVSALVGFSALLVGGFSRFGVWRQIVGAISLLVMLKLLEGVTTEPVRNAATLWPVMYLPVVSGLTAAGILLAWAGRTHRRPGRAPAKVSPA